MFRFHILFFRAVVSSSWSWVCASLEVPDFLELEIWKLSREEKSWSRKSNPKSWKISSTILPRAFYWGPLMVHIRNLSCVSRWIMAWSRKTKNTVTICSPIKHVFIALIDPVSLEYLVITHYCLSQWLIFKLWGITYLIGVIMFKIPLAE